ncbi:MAG TPA: TaqI-like C-terminal specificity domain-containing protein, partial [bacterium]|nr:TaqI-like C-terminal specificity domain-containing protein [bacterium]
VSVLKEPKIVSQNIVAHIENPVPHIRIICTLDKEGLLNLDTVNNTVVTNPDWSHEILVAILNSKLISWYMYRFIYNQAIRTMHFDSNYVGRLPLPAIQNGEKETLERLVIFASQHKIQNEKEMFLRCDKQIDELIYNLYELTAKETEMVELSTFHGEE